MSHPSQSGNVLFYILIAIALLAVLSFTVSQGGRSGSSNISDERSALIASEIIEYANNVATAVAQLKLRGYTDQQISFENDVMSGYENTNCDDDGDSSDDNGDGCEIFHINGGGVVYSSPPPEALDTSNDGSAEYANWYFPIQVCVYGVPIVSAANCKSDGIDNEDLLIMLPWIDENVCKAINRMLGVSDSEGTPPIDANRPVPTTFPKFTGTYGEGELLGNGVPSGLTTGCIYSDDDDTRGYFFYKVLIAR
ncbi:MAG: hypothetical protein KTR28_04510 [Micavibrio sp.]|nr:hypothetical protein [Micavibrio sp.]